MSMWDDIDKIYRTPGFELKIGTIVVIHVILDKDLDNYDQDTIPNIINNWTYPKNEKDIKPFKLLKFSSLKNSFQAEIKYMKKDKELDELKLFCQDIAHFFNYYHVQIKELECSLI